MEGFVKKGIRSITDKNFGESLYNEKLGDTIKTGLAFIAMVIAIGAVLLTAGLYFSSYKLADMIENRLADFEFNRGILVYNGAMPAKPFEYQDNVVIVDTTGVVNVHKLESYSNAVLITADTVYLKSNYSEDKSFEFGVYEKFNLTKKQIIDFLRGGILTFLTLLAFIILAATLLWKTMMILIVTLIGLAISQKEGNALNNRLILQMSIYAAIPATLFMIPLDMTGIGFPYGWIIYSSISIYYMIRHIKSYNKAGENYGE